MPIPRAPLDPFAYLRAPVLTAMLAASLSVPVHSALAQEPAPESPSRPPAEESRPPGVLELRAMANKAYQQGDYAAYRDALLQLHAMRPYNASYMAMLVLAHSLLEERSKAYEMMLYMQQQGLAWDFNETEESANIRGTEVYDYVNDLLVQARTPAGQAELMFELPENIVLPTSMAWDPSREAWLVGDARQGAVHAVKADGSVTTLVAANADNGLWSIFGLLVDAGNNRLWVSSSANESQLGFDPVDAGRSALLEFRLDDLELVRRYPVPVDGSPHRLGGLVRTAAGDIYAVDTILPIIYRLSEGADRLRPFLASRGMVSLRGITLSDDDRHLYVADYEMGVLVVDLVESKAESLRAAPTLNLGGIEGLFYKDGHLITIQNGNEPQRIMSLKLGDDGLAVTGVGALAVAQPFFDYPNFGALRGDELVFLANSHWVRDLDEPEPIRVARTRVSAAKDLNVDQEKLLRELERRGASAISSGAGAQKQP